MFVFAWSGVVWVRVRVGLANSDAFVFVFVFVFGLLFVFVFGRHFTSLIDLLPVIDGSCRWHIVVLAGEK